MLPAGERLMDQLRGMDIARNRIRLDGLSPPAAVTEKLTAEDARKLLKVTQLEAVKEKLREIERSCVSYKEFVEICTGTCLNEEQGHEFAKMLDQSGTVIVLGDVVFLRPDQVDPHFLLLIVIIFFCFVYIVKLNVTYLYSYTLE